MSKFKGASTLLWLGISLAGFLILALSLSQLRLHPGIPFSLGNPPPTLTQSDTSITNSLDLVTIIRGFAAIAAVLLVIYLVIHLLDPEGRKRLLSDLGALAVIFLLITLLPKNVRSTGISNPAPATPPQQPTQAGPVTEISAFVKNPPAWVDLIAIAILAVLIAAVVWILFRSNRPPARKPGTLDRLAEQAEIALDALRTGESTGNTILRCYYAMEKAVREQLNLEREKAMTVQEFEVQLIAQGLPGLAVRQLAELFQQVRYGSELMGPEAEGKAEASLSAILAACQGAQNQPDLPAAAGAGEGGHPSEGSPS